jgi:hypothetical protein
LRTTAALVSPFFFVLFGALDFVFAWTLDFDLDFAPDDFLAANFLAVAFLAIRLTSLVCILK